jgi:hypothetical protein
MNFAAALVDGAARYPTAPANVVELIQRGVGSVEAGPGIRFLSHLLLGIEPPASLQKPLQAGVGTASGLSAESARRAAVVLLASPEAQIG